MREAADDEDGPPTSSVNDIMFETNAEPHGMGTPVRYPSGGGNKENES